MIVMKFGGTSVGSGARIAGVVEITAQTMAKTGTPPVVVVSAMSGVTDKLIKAAKQASQGDRRTFTQIRDELQAVHEEAINECVPNAEYARSLKAEISALLTWFETLCQSIATLGELTARGMDVVSGMGERLSARITAAAMVSHGIKAQMIEATELIKINSKEGSPSKIIGSDFWLILFSTSLVITSIVSFLICALAKSSSIISLATSEEEAVSTLKLAGKRAFTSRMFKIEMIFETFWFKLE